MTDALDQRIRQEDPMADPGAPEPESLISGDFWQKVAERRERDGRQRRRKVAAAVIVALVVGLALGFAPGGIGASGQAAAAAQALRTIADHARNSVSSPAGGTWLHRTMDFSITSPTTTIEGGKATAARSVTLAGVLQSWAKGTKACESSTFQPAQFGSPRRQADWQAVGLEISPTAGAHGYCTTGIKPLPGFTPTKVLSNGILPINVSHLPDKPAMLARVLRTGKSGVPSLDRGVTQRSPQAPFERAVLLLLAPTVGAGPGFPSEVYQAMALLPHVVSLGTVWTHMGKTGQGFAASKGSDAVTMVVNHRGTLLEVRNLQITAWKGNWATLVAQSFAATSDKAESWADPPLANQLVFRTSWVDPVGPSTSVGATVVPAFRERVKS